MLFIQSLRLLERQVSVRNSSMNIPRWHLSNCFCIDLAGSGYSIWWAGAGIPILAFTSLAHSLFFIYWLQKGFIFLLGILDNSNMVSSMCNLCNICLNGSNPSFLQLSLVVIHRSGNVTCVDAKKYCSLSTTVIPWSNKRMKKTSDV